MGNFTTSTMMFRPYKNQEFYSSLKLNAVKIPYLQSRVKPLDFVSENDTNRLIEMAWQDRVPFEIIKLQYGLSENQLKNKMRSLISEKAYKRWRKRVQGRNTKHIKKLYHKPDRFQGPW